MNILEKTDPHILAGSVRKYMKIFIRARMVSDVWANRLLGLMASADLMVGGKV